MIQRLHRKFFGRPARLDHGRMYMSIMGGLLLWSLALLTIGPIPNSAVSELSDYVQDVLALCIFIGSFVCLSGCIIGTGFIPWVVKKLTLGKLHLATSDVRLAYKFGLWGMPAIVGSIGTYVWAIAHDSGTFWIAALGGALGLAILIGTAWNALDFLAEIPTLGDKIQYLKAEEKAEQDDIK